MLHSTVYTKIEIIKDNNSYLNKIVFYGGSRGGGTAGTGIRGDVHPPTPNQNSVSAPEALIVFRLKNIN